jgi:hypothetical protein
MMFEKLKRLASALEYVMAREIESTTTSQRSRACFRGLTSVPGFVVGS